MESAQAPDAIRFPHRGGHKINIFILAASKSPRLHQAVAGWLRSAHRNPRVPREEGRLSRERELTKRGPRSSFGLLANIPDIWGGRCRRDDARLICSAHQSDSDFVRRAKRKNVSAIPEPDPYFKLCLRYRAESHTRPKGGTTLWDRCLNKRSVDRPLPYGRGPEPILNKSFTQRHS